MTEPLRRSVLRDRRLFALLLGESISTTGSRMTALALPWFVLTTTGSAKQMSFVVASEVAAYALAGLPSGLVLARLGSRRTMLICDSLRAPLMLVIPVLFWLHELHLSELVALAFVVGILSAPYGAAQRILMAELLNDDPSRVGQANALFQGAQRTTAVLGPALAGVLIALIGAPRVLVIDAASFAVAFSLVGVLVPRPAIARPQDEQTPRLLDGLRYLKKDGLLARICAALIVGDGMYTVIFLGIPVLVFAHYAANARLAGVFLGAWGVGAVLGNVMAYRNLTEGASDKLMAFLFVIQALPLCTLALAVPAYAIVLAMATSGLGNGLANPTLHSMMTLRPPAPVRPNVLTAFMTASAIGAPVAVVVAGAAFKPLGSRVVIAIAAAVLVCVGLFVAHAFMRSAAEKRP
jgi:MFS family permease